MSGFKSRYVAKKPDEKGFIDYTPEEDEVWGTLYRQQVVLSPGRACQEHIEGVATLALDAKHVPQLPTVSEHLAAATAWRVCPVEALISPEEFFQLLSDCYFPAATFIRTKEEIHYVKEPDIFHELFGHCPMLTEPTFARFVKAYADLVLRCDPKDWTLLQRLFWFTVEFGLIDTPQGTRAYGGGIISSPKELDYSVNSDIPQRVPFDPLVALRTPYRIDRLQPIYFVINSYQQLFDLIESADMGGLIAQARKLGEFPPLFPVEKNNPNIHIFAC